MGKDYGKREFEPIHLHIQAIAARAESDCRVMVYEGSLPNSILISNGINVIVATSLHGWIAVSKDDIDGLIDDLRNVQEDMRRNIWEDDDDESES